MGARELQVGASERREAPAQIGRRQAGQRSLEAMGGGDAVFHTAAYFREYYGAGHHWPKLEAINVRGTLALAEVARAQGVKRLIDTSSSGTIGLEPDGSPGNEETPPAPLANRNLYFK